MKIYDIVAEARQIGRGDYAGFVWDQPTGSRNITVTFPDGRTTTVTNQADARRVADEWRARANGSTAGPPEDTSKDKSRNTSARAHARATVSFRNARRLMSTIGGVWLSYEVYQEMEEQMKRLWDARQSGEIQTQEAYERAVSSAFGTWVAVALPTSIGILGTLGRHALMPLVRSMRGVNIATSAAAAATGVLTIPAVIKFIIWEAGVWAGVYLISTSENVQKWFATYMYTALWVRVAEALEVSADTIVNAKSAILRAAGQPQAPGREEQVRARTIAGLDPELLARAAADEIEDEAAKRTQNPSGTRNPPRAAGNATTNRSATGNSGDNSWMMPQELR